LVIGKAAERLGAQKIVRTWMEANPERVRLGFDVVGSADQISWLESRASF
jgi:hypothetical protein